MTWGIQLDEPQTAEEILARYATIKRRFASAEVDYIARQAQEVIDREQRSKDQQEAARQAVIRRAIEKSLAEETARPEAKEALRLSMVYSGECVDLPKVTASAIIAECARVAGLTRTELLSNCRRKRIVRARQMATWMIYNFRPMSLPEVGMHMGGQNHTTVLSSCRRISGIIGDLASTIRHAHDIKAMDYKDAAAAIWPLLDVSDRDYLPEGGALCSRKT
jgi:chromosomal replication initiation ATPase DnaA